MSSIRPETPDDAGAIRSVTRLAFAGMEHADGDEHLLVGRLREAGDLALSLVVEQGGQIVGHIAFSPVTISDGSADWYGLGPVSVLPECQGAGIGSKLVHRGINNIRAAGAKGIVVLGDPEFYTRFGFEHDPDLAYPGLPPEYFQRLVLSGQAPRGTVRYAPAFGG